MKETENNYWYLLFLGSHTREKENDRGKERSTRTEDFVIHAEKELLPNLESITHSKRTNLSEDDKKDLSRLFSRSNYLRKNCVSLTDLTQNAPVSRNLNRSKSLLSLFKFNTNDSPIEKVLKTNKSTSMKRHKVRSLSLSDLTCDSNNNFKRFKKSKSVSSITNTLIDLDNTLLIYAAVANDDKNDTISAETESDTNDDDYGDINEGRKRRHEADPSTWKKNKNKRLRMQGKEYLGYRKPKHEKLSHDTQRPARELGPTCKSTFCLKSKLRGCSQFTDENRKELHDNFWKKMNWDQRKIFVSGLVTRSETNRKTKSDAPSRREGTLSYFLPITRNNDNKAQVCREMFLNTLSLGSFTVQSWVKKAEFGITPNQEIKNSSRIKTPRAGDERKMLTLNQFLDNIPKLPSHYARKDTTKLFVEPTYHTLKELFDAYKTYCLENEEPQVCRYTFEDRFHKKNLALYTLKKDMCDVCSSHKAGNLNEADYQMHIIKKDRARNEKTQDKEKAHAGEFILLTMDLEAVKVCPYLTASALYFKTKLTCHNFTVFDLVSKHCTCYWFDETAADLSANTFASFLIDYLEKHCMALRRPIVIFSDGCTYQNRNAILSNALLHLAKKFQVTITQKFLEPGHTQMECDSVHSAIETKLKNREIHLPSDYVTITKEARKGNPYETVQADHTFFKHYANSDTFVYKSIRPGRRAGDPQVVDLRAIKYNPDLTISFKINFDDEWRELPQRPKLRSETNYHQLYSARLPIQSSKFNHLQQLKEVLPSDCHSYYDSLPYV